MFKLFDDPKNDFIAGVALDSSRCFKATQLLNIPSLWQCVATLFLTLAHIGRLGVFGEQFMTEKCSCK